MTVACNDTTMSPSSPSNFRRNSCDTGIRPYSGPFLDAGDSACGRLEGSDLPSPRPLAGPPPCGEMVARTRGSRVGRGDSTVR